MAHEGTEVAGKGFTVRIQRKGRAYHNYRPGLPCQRLIYGRIQADTIPHGNHFFPFPVILLYELYRYLSHVAKNFRKDTNKNKKGCQKAALKVVMFC